MIKDNENVPKNVEDTQAKTAVETQAETIEENIKEIILNDNNLSGDCKKIISKVSYDSLLDMQNTFENYKTFTFIELFDILSTCMIFVENITLNKIKLDGETKKKMVLFLSHFFIRTNIKDEEFLKLYNKHANDIIEKIIYSSVFLNIENTIQNKCCNIF